MPILRLNAGPAGLVLHGSPASPRSAIGRAAAGKGPIIILVHGFKYDPDITEHSPHNSIFASPRYRARQMHSHWLPAMGFGTGRTTEGLAIAFGWRARGDLTCAMDAARQAGQHLAKVITDLRALAPGRPIHAVSHSMGSEVVFEALHELAAGSIDRIVTLTGASYASRAAEAVRSPAGRTIELFNVTSRENDVFDALFERLTVSRNGNDRAIGVGLDLPNVVNIQLDCAQSLVALRRFGGHISAAQTRVCHWSGYTRPGALRFFARALRRPGDVPLQALRQVLPATMAPRWSRLFTRPNIPLPLPNLIKTATCRSEFTGESDDRSVLLADTERMENIHRA